MPLARCDPAIRALRPDAVPILRPGGDEAGPPSAHNHLHGVRLQAKRGDSGRGHAHRYPDPAGQRQPDHPDLNVLQLRTGSAI